MYDKTTLATMIGITIAVLVVVGLVLGLSPMFTPDEPDEPIIPIVNGQTEGETDIFVNANAVIIFEDASERGCVASGYGKVSIPAGDWSPQTIGTYNWKLVSWNGGFVLYAWE